MPPAVLVAHDPAVVAKHQLRGLDGLRAVAALAVFVYHLRWIAGEPQLIIAGVDIHPYLRQLDLGVCVFFVLSGFLLSIPFWKALELDGSVPSFKKYITRRLARVYPGFLLVLICFSVVQPGTYSFWGLTSLLLQLTGLHTFADFSFNGAVPVLWTIGIEIQFYLALPCLFLLLSRVPLRKPLLHIVLLFIVTTAAQVSWPLIADGVLSYLPERFYSLDGPVRSRSVFHFLPWFFWGIASARLSMTVRWRALSQWQVNGIGAVGIVYLGAAVIWGYEGGWRSVGRFGWPALPAASAALVIASTQSVVASRILDSRIIATIGTWSYGIYLWHWPVLKAVFGGTLPNRLSPSESFIVCGTISLGVTCVIAALIWRFLESPVIRSVRS